MAIIENIPEAMLDEHVNWHTRPGNPAGGGRSINPWPAGSTTPTPGSGEEFLVWHKGYLDRFRAWVDALPGGERPDAAAIEPWTSIPLGLKMGMLGWNSSRAADEAQLSDMSNFDTLDELGAFLEWGLHGWLHGASAQMWSEPVLTSFRSPRSTYFWQLHGLIDHWRAQWVEHNESGVRIDPHLLEILRVLGRMRRPVPPIPVPFPRPVPVPPRPQPDPVPIFDLTPDENRLISMMRSLRPN